MMRENTTFDNQIKKKLEELNSAPPDYMWDRIQGGLNISPAKPNVWFKKLFVRISAAILLLLVIAFGWYYFSGTELVSDTKSESKVTGKEINNSGVEPNSEKEKAELANNVIAQKIKPIDSKTIAKKQISTKDLTHVKVAHREIIKSASNTTNYVGISPEKFKIIETPEIVTQTNSITEVNNSEPINKYNESEIIHQSSSEISTPIDTLQNSIKAETNSSDKAQENNLNSAPVKPENMAKSELPELNIYQIGIHYGAANMFNTNNQNPAQIPSVSFSYKNLNFVFRTSFSMMYSYEEAKYNMYYKTKVFDRKQNITNDLGSIWDPISQQYLPVVYQSNSEDVYKVLNDTFSSFAKDKYYNFRVPVMLGYNKNIRKFGYGAFVGIAYTKQMYKKTEGLKELDNNSTLTKLYYPVLQRRRNNLEYLLSANVSYQILPKFTFEFEIQSSFMQNSIYLNPKEKNSISWFAGFGAGLLYQF